MKKVLKIAASGVLFVFCFCAHYSYALETEFHGRIQSNFVLRDDNGFQYGFGDNWKGVQWRNELKFDITARPEYEMPQQFWLDKIFLSYRGAYDAIFDVTDRYDGMREKSPADFELGRDDLETENDLREAFVDLLFETEETSTTLRLGRQIVQWGEADGFNLINMVNPSDYSNHMFFTSPEDLAIPLWMARFNYSMARLGPLQNVGLEVLLVPDIRPTQMAPMDDAISTRSCAPYMKGFQQLKRIPLPYFYQLVDDLFAPFLALVPGLDPHKDLHSINTLEQPNQTAQLLGVETFMYDPPLRVHEDVPGRTFDNMEYGVRLQAAYESFIANLYYYHGWQNDAAIDWTELCRPTGTVYMRHPEQDMFGFSFNVFLSAINAVLRGESSMVSKYGWLDIRGVYGGLDILYNDTLDQMGPILGLTPEQIEGMKLPHSTTGWLLRKTYWNLIGLDKDLWLRWINPNDMIGTSWQFYWRHIHDWNEEHITSAWESKADNYRLTGYFYTDYLHGQIHPELFVMYDPQGTWMTMASVKYSKDGRLYFKLGQMSFWGNGGWANNEHPHVGWNMGTSPFNAPYDLMSWSEVSFKVGYNW